MAVNDANYSHRTPGTLYKSYNLVLKFSIQQSYFFSERITSIGLFNVSSKEWEMRCTAHVKSPTTLSNLSTRKEYHKNLYHEKKKKDYLKKDSSKPTQVLKSQAMKPYWRFKTQIRDSK